MSIMATAAYREDLGGQSRVLRLSNTEIERFEALPGKPGIFDVLQQLNGSLPGLRVSLCRDLVALALVGGGCPDRVAEDIVAAMGPEDNIRIRAIAQRALGLAFFPAALADPEKKSDPASPPARSRRRTTAPQPV